MINRTKTRFFRSAGAPGPESFTELSTDFGDNCGNPSGTCLFEPDGPGAAIRRDCSSGTCPQRILVPVLGRNLLIPGDKWVGQFLINRTEMRFFRGAGARRRDHSQGYPQILGITGKTLRKWRWWPGALSGGRCWCVSHPVAGPGGKGSHSCRNFASQGRQLGNFTPRQHGTIHSVGVATEIERITCELSHTTRCYAPNLLI